MVWGADSYVPSLLRSTLHLPFFTDRVDVDAIPLLKGHSWPTNTCLSLALLFSEKLILPSILQLPVRMCPLFGAYRKYCTQYDSHSEQHHAPEPILPEESATRDPPREYDVTKPTTPCDELKFNLQTTASTYYLFQQQPCEKSDEILWGSR